MSFLLLVSYGAMVSEGGILLASILFIKADIRASLAGPLFFTIYNQNTRKLFLFISYERLLLQTC